MPEKTKEQPGLLITATQLKQELGKYLDMTAAGNRLIITKNGGKIARLTPYVGDRDRYLSVKERALDYQYGGKKVSYEEFIQIYDQTTLRMEFINREIHLLDSPTVHHQELLGKLYLTFNDYFKGKTCRVFFAPFDVHFHKEGFTEPDVMQPNLLVACDLAGNITAKGKYMGTPKLVIEILSAGSRNKDLITKLDSYRLSGVEEYWIVDPRQASIMIYNFIDRAIDGVKMYERERVAKSQIFSGLVVDVEDLFSDLSTPTQGAQEMDVDSAEKS